MTSPPSPRESSNHGTLNLNLPFVLADAGDEKDVVPSVVGEEDACLIAGKVVGIVAGAREGGRPLIAGGREGRRRWAAGAHEERTNLFLA